MTEIADWRDYLDRAAAWRAVRRTCPPERTSTAVERGAWAAAHFDDYLAYAEESFELMSRRAWIMRATTWLPVPDRVIDELLRERGM